MESKHFGRVSVVQRVNEVHVLWVLDTFRDHVSLVEVEGWCEHGVPEPHLAESVQQTLVEVVGHTAAILDLAEHVPNSGPIHTLLKMKMI